MHSLDQCADVLLTQGPMKPPTAPQLLMNEKPTLACSPGKNTAGQEKKGPAGGVRGLDQLGRAGCTWATQGMGEDRKRAALAAGGSGRTRGIRAWYTE